MVDEADVSQVMADMAGKFRSRAEELTADLVARYEQDIPPLSDDEHMMSLLAASVYQNVETVIRVVEHQMDISNVDAPAAAFEYARRLAQRGIPVVDLIRAYHIGQKAIVEHAMAYGIAEIHDPEMLGAGLRRVVTVGFEYIHRVTNQVVSAYEEERNRWLNNRSAVRVARVRSMLSDDTIDIDSGEASLGYRLRGPHVGMVAWHAVDQDVSALSDLEKLSIDLAGRLRCAGRPLFVPCDDTSAWVWLPVEEIPGREVCEQALADSDPGVRLAIGEPGTGLAGFRHTHRQALRVHNLGRAAGEHCERVMSFGEVGSVTLMVSDIDSAKAWVADVLGQLAANDEHHQRLRETLRVFLATGGSYTSAATQLTMHKNSVQYRVRKAEEVLGHPVNDDRLDVELALSLCRWLGTAVLPAH